MAESSLEFKYLMDGESSCARNTGRLNLLKRAELPFWATYSLGVWIFFRVHIVRLRIPLRFRNSFCATRVLKCGPVFSFTNADSVCLYEKFSRAAASLEIWPKSPNAEIRKFVKISKNVLRSGSLFKIPKPASRLTYLL